LKILNKTTAEVGHADFSACQLALTVPLTQGIHMLAELLAIFKRTVAWRGVTNCVRGPWDIRMIRYCPVEQPAQAAASNMSL
jgi:hypothetical protein